MWRAFGGTFRVNFLNYFCRCEKFTENLRQQVNLHASPASANKIPPIGFAQSSFTLPPDASFSLVINRETPIQPQYGFICTSTLAKRILPSKQQVQPYALWFSVCFWIQLFASTWHRAQLWPTPQWNKFSVHSEREELRSNWNEMFEGVINPAAIVKARFRPGLMFQPVLSIQVPFADVCNRLLWWFIFRQSGIE